MYRGLEAGSAMAGAGVRIIMSGLAGLRRGLGPWAERDVRIYVSTDREEAARTNLNEHHRRSRRIPSWEPAHFIFNL